MVQSHVPLTILSRKLRKKVRVGLRCRVHRALLAALTHTCHPHGVAEAWHTPFLRGGAEA